MISQKQFKELFEYYNQFENEYPPTIITIHGSKVWKNYKGEWHRENDRPVYIDNDIHISWHKNGKWHRETGPAKIWTNGNCEYYFNDDRVSPKKWFRRLMNI